ncbi:hypothetical protein JW859_07815 [bacterium]|nr:hypothetical protein [bacterium]
MRKFAFLIIALVLVAIPVLALADTDSRRPDLGITAGDRPLDRGGDRDGAELPSYWEEYYVQDLEIGPFMGRLHEVLTNPEMLGRFPEVVSVAGYLDSLGLFNIDRCHTEYEITGEDITFTASDFFSDLDPECYYGQIMALEDRELATAKYVPGTQLLYVGVNNVPEMMMIELKSMKSSTEFVKEFTSELGVDADMDLNDMEEVFALLDAFPIEQTVNALLTGELGIVLYNLPPFEQLVLGDIEPADIEAAVMLGVRDREAVMDMVTGFGAEIGLLEREYEGDDWQYFVVNGEETIGIIFTDDMAVVTSNIDATRDNMKMALAKGGLDLEPCQMYFDMNVEALQEQLIGPAGRMAAEQLGEGIELPWEGMGYLVNLPGSDALGHFTLMTSYGNGYTVDIEMKKAVCQYMVYYGGLAACGLAQSGVFE